MEHSYEREVPVSDRQAPTLLSGLRPWGMLLVALFLWAFWYAGLLEGKIVNAAGGALLLRFLRAALQPELGRGFLELTFLSALTTLAFALCGTFLSLITGLIGGVLGSEVWWQARAATGPEVAGRPISRAWQVVRLALALPRALHELVWGLFLLAVLGLDPLVAILAIAVPYGAITAKVFSEILDETPRRPLMALLGSGVSPARAFAYSLLPAALPQLVSYSFYRLECALRSAAVLGIIGAGGLGYQLLLSLQSLRYEEVWTLLLALWLLVTLTDLCSGMVRRRLERGDARTVSAQPEREVAGDRVIRGAFLLLLLLVPIAFLSLQADYSRLVAPRTLDQLGSLMQAAFPPRMEADYLGLLLALSAQTLAMSILAIVLAGLGAMLLSYLAAANIALPGWISERREGEWVRWGVGGALLGLSRLLLLVCRGTPVPIWALLLLFIFFPGVWPGALALALYNLGVLGRLMAESVENMDLRPVRALEGQGVPSAHLFLYAIIPRNLPTFLAYILYRWEVIIRETVAVGIVGAGGLGRLLTEQLSSFDYRSVVTTLLFLITLTFLVDWISTASRRAMREGR